MASYTLITRDREFRLEQVETLRELVDRRLISPEDQVLVDGATESLSVGEMLARLDAGLPPPIAEPPGDGRSGAKPTPLAVGDKRGTAADPWRAWDTDESVEVDDLVSQLLDDVAGHREPPEHPRESEPDDADTDLWLTQLSQREAKPPPPAVPEEDELPDIPQDSIEVLAEIPRSEPPRPTPRGSSTRRESVGGPGPERGASGSFRPVGDPAPGETGPSTNTPRSFVEYVQQKRAVNTPLQLHEDPAAPVLERVDRRLPLFFWPAVVGILAALGALSYYGVVRTGAERLYPTESEVRARLEDNPGGLEAVIEEVSDRDVTEEALVPAAATDVHRESRLRSEIPAAVGRFRNVETFKDALFIDLANSGVLVREIRVEALVVAPFDPHRQKPEEVNLELWILAPQGEAGMDATYKTALIVGHYGSVAHVRIQELVIHVAAEGEVWATFLTRGTTAVGFYEGEVDLHAFDLSTDRVADGEYIDPESEDSD